MKRYHEFGIGDMLRVGPILVNALDAKQFAAKYDPLAEVPGAAGPQATLRFGRTASPLFVLAFCLQPLHAEMLAAGAALAGPPILLGFRFPNPVYPNDRLRIEAEIVSKRLSGETGKVRQRLRATNQNGSEVLAGAISWPLFAPPRISVIRRETVGA